jgi:hypothetical protein
MSECELFDPIANEWSKTGSLLQPRMTHNSVVLGDGQVLAVGGENDLGLVLVCERYDAGSGLWETAGAISVGKILHRTVVLADGSVLSINGSGTFVGDGETVERYNPYSSVIPQRPVVAGTPVAYVPGRPFSVSGNGFRGVSEGSTGSYQSSPTNYPVVTIQSLSNERIANLSLQSTGTWDSNSVDAFGSTVLPVGFAFVGVSTNGVPSNRLIIEVTYPEPPTGLTALAMSSSRIDLTWADTTPDEIGFKIERRTEAGPWSQIATVGPNVASYSNIGLSSGVGYSYRVRSVNTRPSSPGSRPRCSSLPKVRSRFRTNGSSRRRLGTSHQLAERPEASTRRQR